MTAFISASQKIHSQELLEYLQHELGQSVPSPNYNNELDAPALQNDAEN
jgi:hypothetical protein